MTWVALEETVVVPEPVNVTSSLAFAESLRRSVPWLATVFATARRSYVVLGSTGRVTVLVLTNVTCPRAFVVIESIAVNVPPDAGETPDVAFDLATSEWSTYTAVVLDETTISSRPINFAVSVVAFEPVRLTRPSLATVFAAVARS